MASERTTLAENRLRDDTLWKDDELTSVIQESNIEVYGRSLISKICRRCSSCWVFHLTNPVDGAADQYLTLVDKAASHF